MQQYIIMNENEKLPVEIIYSKRKTIGIKVAADLKIKVCCPQWFTDEDVIRFCEEHKKQILDCYRRANLYFGDVSRRDRFYSDIYTEGRIIPLGDGVIELQRIRNRDEKSVHVYRKREESGVEYLCMASGVENNPELYRAAVTKWLREYARIELSKKVSIYAKQMQVSVGKITIREQKTRWGSCSSKGKLNFNWKLILMPENIQDYVVVHELAHRKQMNHSKDFWREVAVVLPDYQERRDWLRKHEGEFGMY